MFGRRLLAVLVVAGAVAGAGPASAQEDLNRGKSAQQLFASDCSDCHKNPRAIKQRDSAYSLAAYLRVHYTASRENAAAIASYLVSLGGPVEPARTVRPRPPASTDQRRTGQAPKPSAAGGSKPSDSKPAETKPAETKPIEAKPADSKPVEAKPAEPKPPEPASATPPANPQ